MKIAGIIAEYNPFHNGHALLIEKARELGAQCIVAVMSGNFVQRGEPALFRNDIRVRAALEGGADLVLRLPVACATAGAKNFALGAVKILDALGCVDSLIFGSECANTQLLCKTAELIEGEAVQNAIADEMKKGIAFANARENALRSLSPECAEVIRNANDILAVEYISALNRLNSSIKPYAIKREGVGHDSTASSGSIASASYIRELITNNEKWDDFVPEGVYKVLSVASDEQKITDFSKLENAVLYRLRTASKQEIALCPDASEGIENRIASALREAVSLEELYSKVKTKRYSHARIRRIILSLYLGITAADAADAASYIGVCGFSDRGAELLKRAYETATLPIITKAAELKNANEAAKKAYETECKAGDIYALLTDKTGICSATVREIPIKK